MARILGVDIPNNKRVIISLTYVYGIGKSRSLEILAKAKIDENRKVSSLSEEELALIRKIASAYLIEGDLRREQAMNIKRLMEIGCYIGIRHRKGLPTRGQRTKSNARTRKGPRKTVANKKIETK